MSDLPVRSSSLKTALTVPLLIVWILVMVLLYQANRLLGFADRWTLIRRFHVGVAWCFNLKVEYQGELYTDSPTIYVSNHVSYLDVFVLGAKLPGSFVAKSEVASWPVLGKLATLQGTLFFERNARRARQQVDILKSLLAHGNPLIFFPEGTSTPGTHVEKFRSTLLAAAEMEGVRIQPVSIAYTDYKGVKMDSSARDFYAWYIPMPFLSHFLGGLGLGKAGVKVVLHEPVQMSDFDSRKSCATYCEDRVRQGLLAALGQNEEIIPEHYLEAIGRAT